MQEESKPSYKFYDSDADSMMERDFLSDSEPPKDELRERKLLRKEKFKHIYKSIYRLGYHLDKPARYDLISMRMFRPAEKPTEFILSSPFLTFNLGLAEEYLPIQELLISMKKGEIAMFEIEHLKTSESNSMKVLDYAQFYVIEMKEWTTVIDLIGDRRFMKQVLEKGEGGERVSMSDEVKLSYEVAWGDHIVDKRDIQEPTLLTQKVIDCFPSCVWKVVNTMKVKERNLCELTLETYLQHETNLNVKSKLEQLKESYADQEHLPQLSITAHVKWLHKIDDLLFDGSLLKKTVRKGNSTARPEDTSIVFYALEWLAADGATLRKDETFELQQESLEQLEQLPNVRHHYLDEYRVSKMLKRILFRTKPLEIAEITCNNPGLVTYGADHAQILELYQGQVPVPLRFRIKMFNFTEGKTAYNMGVEEKLFHSQRKRKVGISLLNSGHFHKAKKEFDEINNYFEYGVENEEDKVKLREPHLSSLLNTSLCCSKLSDFPGVISVCKRIKGIRPSEKCTYRLSAAYGQIGQAEKGLQEIEEWEKGGNTLSEQTKKLQQQLLVKLEQYKKKSKKVFSNMFSSRDD